MRAQNMLGGPEVKCSPEGSAQNAISFEQQVPASAVGGPREELSMPGEATTRPMAPGVSADGSEWGGLLWVAALDWSSILRTIRPSCRGNVLMRHRDGFLRLFPE